VGVVLVELHCHVVELVDVCLVVEQQGEDRVFDSFLLVLGLLLDDSLRLVLFSIVAAFHLEREVAEVVCFLCEGEHDPEMISFGVKQFDVEVADPGDAANIDLFGQEAFFVEDDAPEVLDLLRFGLPLDLLLDAFWRVELFV
jgi:hypothetical protein